MKFKKKKKEERAERIKKVAVTKRIHTPSIFNYRQEGLVGPFLSGELMDMAREQVTVLSDVTSGSYLCASGGESAHERSWFNQVGLDHNAKTKTK